MMVRYGYVMVVEELPRGLAVLFVVGVGTDRLQRLLVTVDPPFGLPCPDITMPPAPSSNSYYNSNLARYTPSALPIWL